MLTYTELLPQSKNLIINAKKEKHVFMDGETDLVNLKFNNLKVIFKDGEPQEVWKENHKINCGEDLQKKVKAEKYILDAARYIYDLEEFSIVDYRMN